MRSSIKIFLLVCAFAASSGCYFRRDSVELEKQRRASLEIQSIMDMAYSRRIPPVDFKFDSAELLESSYMLLDKVAGVLLSYPTLKLIVEGHTDDVGGDEYNDKLSFARASSVKSYLVRRGVYPDSIKIYGYGKRRPIVADESDNGRAMNRRVEFRITARRWESVY